VNREGQQQGASAGTYLQHELASSYARTHELAKSHLENFCNHQINSTQRPDKGLFQASDYGSKLSGWAGEFWLDVRSANVKVIMTAVSVWVLVCM
jgi:hypothetical protein